MSWGENRFGDVPTLYVQVNRRINLGNFESMDVTIGVSKIPFDATDAEIEDAVNTGKRAWGFIHQRLRDEIRALRHEASEDEQEDLRSKTRT